MMGLSPHKGDPNWFLLAKSAVGISFIVIAPFLVMPTIRSFNQARQSASWPQTDAEITKSEVVKKDVRGKPSWNPNISYRYTVDGKDFTSSEVSWRSFNTPIYSHAEEVATKYPVGSVHKAFYSPDDPSKSVLESGTNWMVTLNLFFPLFFVLLGGYMVHDNFTFYRDRMQKPKKKKRKKLKAKTGSDPPTKRRKRKRYKGDLD
ncbi:DUF3592 domain-containing protein [uncultured Gimesia sp.]|uniref:DUF3592 domain-containing protein n=1 Tax=uncultured Gimesia sp. TaxID=1678688 RepID=UPI0026178436|nr:DUF3592 domain-containing protein [uncultured Gimesia sp.]